MYIIVYSILYIYIDSRLCTLRSPLPWAANEGRTPVDRYCLVGSFAERGSAALRTFSWTISNNKKSRSSCWIELTFCVTSRYKSRCGHVVPRFLILTSDTSGIISVPNTELITDQFLDSKVQHKWIIRAYPGRHTPLRNAFTIFSVTYLTEATWSWPWWT